ncbi:protein THEMIS [Chanos chanos]|uniref:Protein THEMIS n=1 Tax=Chanos chanos TaxID=29144 RepID=A0A6J2W0B9_CHACN|nr:protein THEMIS [Chanos chanos]
MAMTLDEFTRSVDCNSLPRVLQIQSGVYSQGSVYEMFGREVSLPTGELVKIIAISITRFIAQSSDTTEINLQLNYPGLFRIVADKQPYSSVQEIVDSLKISSHRLSQPVFHVSSDLKLSKVMVKKGESFQITAVRLDENGGHVDCDLLQREGKQTFSLKLSQQGDFFESEDDQFYTLKELAEWKIPKGRKRTVTVAKSQIKRDSIFPDLLENHSGELTLTPVYELQAVMKLRKNVVLIPSSLDVEVVDVTDQCNSDCFLQPLSLHDVFQRPGEMFPMLAEVIEKPFNLPHDLQELFHSKQVIIHKAYEAKRILSSEIRSDSPRHFLIPLSYNGKFKRRPREFPTAYDLQMARSDTEQLHVVATRSFDSHYDGLSSVLVGDQFLLKKSKAGEGLPSDKGRVSDALACLKIEGKKYESVRLPIFLNGGFVEVIHDTRQYTIAEICRWFPLPFNVKVSVRDLSVKEDILAGVPGLHIEEEITDPFLLISTPDLLVCWEVPVNRIQVTLQVLEKWRGSSLELNANSAVEEISEDCYYTMRRYVISKNQPPPRPPKKPRNQPPARPAKLHPPRPERSTPSSSQNSPKSPRVDLLSPEEGSTDFTNSKTGREVKPPVSPNNVLPTPLSKCDLLKASKKVRSLDDMKVEDEDDPHDYEYIDEDELENIRKKFSEQSIHKTAPGKPNNTI